MDVEVPIVQLGGPTMLLAVAFQIELDIAKVDLVNLVVLIHVLLGLLGNLNGDGSVLSKPAIAEEAPIDSCSGPQQSRRVVV